MTSPSFPPRRPVAISAAFVLAFASATPAWAVSPHGETFTSPDAAAQALATAWRSGRTEDLLKIFGPSGKRLVVSGDKVAEKSARRQLAASYAEAHRIESEGGRSVLVIGANNWPYPIPIVKRRGGWAFDVRAGEEQVLDRRIGRNEISAIESARAYVGAQRDYAARSGSFAQRFVSTPGKHDGLYWPAASKADESPLGPSVAAAEAKGYGPAGQKDAQPFEGYYFRILTRQGPYASGGAKSYIAGGRMTGGFALLAYPAKWGDSGVMTFIVNEAGIVFQRNLGPDTRRIAATMTAFDPDHGWKIAETPQAGSAP